MYVHVATVLTQIYQRHQPDIYPTVMKLSSPIILPAFVPVVTKAEEGAGNEVESCHKFTAIYFVESASFS